MVIPQSTANAKTCLHCGAQGVKNRCGGCRQVYFCDRECQRQCWTAHRPLCGSAATPSSTPEASAGAEMASVAEKQDAASVIAEASKQQELPIKEEEPSAQEEQQEAAVAESRVLEPEAAPSSSDKPKSKKKHKKKHQKKRSNSLHEKPSAPLPRTMSAKNRSISLSVRRHVMWGDVEAREFARFPGGGGAVPYDGTWALGLGAAVGDVTLGTVLEVEERREAELKDRASHMPKAKRRHVREGETRQFDYQRGIDNPLFARLSERERKVKLIEDAEEIASAAKEQPRTRRKSIEKHHREDPADDQEPETPDFACVSSEQLEEFARIRDSRDAACGCSCGDLVKKVTKMNLKKLHGFVAARGVEVSVHTKPELLALAKRIAAQEKNCANSRECECAMNGVGCHANVCDGCAGDCHNPFQSYCYEKDFVRQYRKQQLAKWQTQQQSISVV